MSVSDRLIEQIRIQKEITKRDCRENFYNFFQYFWPAISPEALVDNWHIKFLCDVLQDLGDAVIKREDIEDDLIINVPPGTTKSSITTIAFPAWLWLRDPRIRVISGSYSADIAVDHAVRSRQLLKSYRFIELFGDTIEFQADQDNKSYYANTAGGTRAACGVGGAITGKHAHIILVDDPINPKQAASEVYRKAANDWMDKTLSTRKVDKAKTPTIIIMQRLHDDDPTGFRLAKGRVRHVCLPAEITDLDNVRPRECEAFYVDKLLDPVRMSAETLKWERERLGSIEYAGQFLQSPAAAEGNIFKRAWFKTYNSLPDGPPIRIVNSWDTAFKDKEQNDFSACTTWFEYHNGFYLVDFWQGKVLYPDLKKKVAERSILWCSHRDLIEDKASGQSLIQDLKNDGKAPIVPVQAEKDKILRAKMSTPLLEAGKVFVPEADWINVVLDQLCGFPNTKNDDIVDTVSQFLNWARDNPIDTPIAVGRGRRESDKIMRGFRYGPEKIKF